MMYQHYGVHKPKYNPTMPEEVMEHYFEDVKYTKMLYEEKTWKAPIIERRMERIWENWYDDAEAEAYGAIWDGEYETNTADFGRPVGMPNIIKYLYRDIPSSITCPICKKGEISLYDIVAKRRTDEAICPNCGGIIKFSPGTPIITSTITKEEADKNKCPNCGKHLGENTYETNGYGAGHGFVTNGRSICPACGKGCYEWENDETPGFRDHWYGKCCYCGENIGEWCQLPLPKP